jgi:hypothetical protein
VTYTIYICKYILHTHNTHTHKHVCNIHTEAVSNFEIEVVIIFGQGENLRTHRLVDLKTLFG